MLARVFLLAFLLFEATTAALSAPQRTVADFDDWTLICVFPVDKPKQCEIVSIQMLADQNTAVGQISISRSEKSGPYKLIVQTPPSAWLPAGVKLSVEDKDSVTATYKWCVSTRCAAEGDLTKQLIDKLAKQTAPSSFIFKDAAQNDITIAVSLKGLAPALEALEK